MTRDNYDFKLRDLIKPFPHNGVCYFRTLDYELFNDGETLTRFGLLLKKWIKDNLSNPNECRLFEYRHAGKVIFCVTNKKSYDAFKEFIDNNEFDSITPFKTKRHYLKTMDDERGLNIKEIVDCKNLSGKFSDSNVEQFNLWCWLMDNIKGRYWFWNKKLYFEDTSDALAFKLRWS